MLSDTHFWMFAVQFACFFSYHAHLVVCFFELLKIEMKHSHGFTLIELVVVIVVLGILSVVAAPKFISLRKDSLVSTLYGMRSAIDTAGQETYSMAAVRGLETSASASISSHGQTIPLVYGYPAGGVSNGLSSLIEFPSGDWKQRPAFTMAPGSTGMAPCKRMPVEPSVTCVIGNQPPQVVDRLSISKRRAASNGLASHPPRNA